MARGRFRHIYSLVDVRCKQQNPSNDMKCPHDVLIRTLWIAVRHDSWSPCARQLILLALG